MFAQVIELQAPLDKISELRDLIKLEYLPALAEREGFISAQLMEQVDDRDKARLITLWDSQKSVENVNRTGVLAGSITSISARLPGTQVSRQSYIVTVTNAETKAAV